MNSKKIVNKENAYTGKKMKQKKTSENLVMPKIIYICSNAHAGSTILELLLSGHPQITSLGEVLHLPHELGKGYPCSCGKRIEKCEAWKHALDGIKRKKGIDVVRTPFHFWLGDINPVKGTRWYSKSRWHRFQRNYRRVIEMIHYSTPFKKLMPLPPKVILGIKNTLLLYHFISQTRKKSILVDSSKRYLRALELYDFLPETLSIIYLVRDKRSIMASHMKRGLSREEAFEIWKKYHVRALPLIKKHISHKHWLKVKFEDLLEQPEIVLERICSFIGAKTGCVSQMLRLEGSNLHSIGGNWTRYDKNITLRSVETWKERLSDQDIKYFEKRMKKINNRANLKMN